MSRTIISARIFDGTGSAAALGDVLIEGERVTSLGARGAITPRPDDVVIDMPDATLMPGLIEAHAHLSWPSSIEKMYHEFVLPPEEMGVATRRNARILLDHGFTSAYSAGALAETIEVEVKREIESGMIGGPRLVPSTIERSPDGGEGHGPGTVSHGRGAESMRAFIAKCKEIGVESAKLLISGEDALDPGSSQHILYTENELAAAHEASRAHGIWLAAHTQAAEAIKLALRHGVRTLYHCSWADAEALDLLEAKRDEIFVAPAIGIIVATLEASPPPQVDMTAMKESAKPVLELCQRLMPELRRRGVRVLPGGDYGFPFNPNGRNARDLEHFVTLFGYSVSDTLVAATKLGGELMGRGDELGLVRSGYLADLLLVDGDPTRDVRLLQDKNRLAMIMKGGRMHKAPSRVLQAA